MSTSTKKSLEPAKKPRAKRKSAVLKKHRLTRKKRTLAKIESTTCHDRCRLIAYGNALYMKHSGIINSAEFFKLFEELDWADKDQMRDIVKSDVPIYEARYRFNDYAINHHGIKNVLHLGAGLSPLGFNLTRDGSYLHCDVDFLDIMIMKNEILDRIVADRELPLHRLDGYLRIPGDVLNNDVFSLAMKAFEGMGPVAIITDGLLRFLSKPDKAKLATMIKGLLRKNGGIWINHDVENLRDVGFMPGGNEYYKEIKDSHRIDLLKNLHSTISITEKFYQLLGFSKIEKHDLSEMHMKMHSHFDLQMTNAEFVRVMGKRRVFILSL